MENFNGGFTPNSNQNQTPPPMPNYPKMSNDGLGTAPTQNSTLKPNPNPAPMPPYPKVSNNGLETPPMPNYPKMTNDGFNPAPTPNPNPNQIPNQSSMPPYPKMSNDGLGTTPTPNTMQNYNQAFNPTPTSAPIQNTIPKYNQNATYVNQKSGKKKSVLSIIVTIIVVAGITSYFLVSGISTYMGLKNGVTLDELFTTKSSSEYVDSTVNYCTNEYLRVTHTVNLIPIGKDHYFLIFNKDKTEFISIRADKNWADNFDPSTGYSEKGVKIKGKVKPLKSEYQSKLNETLTEHGFKGYASKQGYYIDIYAGRFAILKIIAGFLLIAIVICGFIFIKGGHELKDVATVRSLGDQILSKFVVYGGVLWGILFAYIMFFQ